MWLRIGQISPGFSGADLANVVNEAAILAARRNKKQIGQIDFEEALEKVALGPERRSRVIGEHWLHGRQIVVPAGPPAMIAAL